jgi:hypothetical protein
MIVYLLVNPETVVYCPGCGDTTELLKPVADEIIGVYDNLDSARAACAGKDYAVLEWETGATGGRLLAEY